MRVVIADDEKFVLVVLKSALRSVRFPIEIVGEALDGDDAYRLCCKKKPDLLITDICMPRKDGLDLLAKLRETQPELPVIIYSGFDNFSYAQKAIHYGVEEYLLKPIRTKTLYPILDRLELRERRPQEALTLRTGGIIVRVPFSQLTYVEVNGKHLYFNLADGQVREVVGSMKEYEDALLTRPEFMRIHRSYIVNMLQIRELSSAGVQTFSGQSLPVSRLLYPQLQKDYMALLFEQREG